MHESLGRHPCCLQMFSFSFFLNANMKPIRRKRNLLRYYCSPLLISLLPSSSCATCSSFHSLAFLPILLELLWRTRWVVKFDVALVGYLVTYIAIEIVVTFLVVCLFTLLDFSCLLFLYKMLFHSDRSYVIE